MSRRFTSAHAIALLALFIALGGTVYAAAKIDGKAIKQRSIPGNRLKPNAVTGAQLAEGSLASVPSAATAASAAKVDTVARAAEAGRVDVVPRAALAKQADTATTADLAESAERAETADLVPFANGATFLAGRGPGAIQKPCESGAIKGFGTFQAKENAEPEFIAGRICASDQRPFASRSRVPSTGAVIPGGFFATFPGITADDAIGSVPGVNSAISINEFGRGDNFLSLFVFSTRTNAFLTDERFTVIVF